MKHNLRRITMFNDICQYKYCPTVALTGEAAINATEDFEIYQLTIYMYTRIQY